jgi:hypothetical protein
MIVAADLNQARVALQAAAGDAGFTVTGLCTAAGISNSLTTFVTGSGGPKDTRLGLLLRALDRAGWELLLRRRPITKRSIRLAHRVAARQAAPA